MEASPEVTRVALSAMIGRIDGRELMARLSRDAQFVHSLLASEGPEYISRENSKLTSAIIDAVKLDKDARQIHLAGANA